MASELVKNSVASGPRSKGEAQPYQAYGEHRSFEIGPRSRNFHKLSEGAHGLRRPTGLDAWRKRRAARRRYGPGPLPHLLHRPEHPVGVAAGTLRHIPQFRGQIMTAQGFPLGQAVDADDLPPLYHLSPARLPGERF